MESGSMVNLASREQILQKILTRSNYDFIIIGGGATGLGIALDAVLRGYQVLLVEGYDFAKGSSSRSTKLVHGGVRYLAQGNIKLVKEACHERHLLLKNVSQLVHRQSFVVPVYSTWEKIKYIIGLKLYDAMAGKESLGKSEFITRNEIVSNFSGLKTKGLQGGVLYYDAQFNDAAMAVGLMQNISMLGGDCINYARVTGLKKNAEGKLAGVEFTDLETGGNYTICGKVIVNATGVFADDILGMDQTLQSKTLSISQGVHLVVDRKFLPGNSAIMIPKTADGRVLFILPWEEKVLLGTTDTYVDEKLLEPIALEAEINFILTTVAGYLDNPPAREDLLSVFAGLRPLAASKEGSLKTKEISRSHKIVESPSGLFTMLGGKWTTFRKMGEDMVNRIERSKHWRHTESISSAYKLAVPSIEDEDNLEYSVKHAIRYEMARTVEDFLARRKRLLFLDAGKAIELAPRVAEIMAAELNKDSAWKNRQLAEFRSLAENYLVKSAL